MKPSLRIVPDAPAGAKPILKWAGGKSWFVDRYGTDMFEHVLKQGGRFIEPFAGGAAMALHLGLGNMLIADAEYELAVLYAIVRDHVEELITMLTMLWSFGTGEKSFYAVRNTNTDKLTLFEQAARTVYLNKLCYNGLFRKNLKGCFNTPWGKDPNRTFDKDAIRAASRALRKVEIYQLDFVKTIALAGAGDTLYIDPPYHETGVAYTAKGFNETDHERLSRELRAAVERGANFFAHNADTDKVRQWYAGWEIISMPEKRQINSKGNGRGEVPCVLIVGGVDE